MPKYYYIKSLLVIEGMQKLFTNFMKKSSTILTYNLICKSENNQKIERIATQFMIFFPKLDPNKVPGFLKFKISQENLISAQSKVKVGPWVNILYT